MKHLKLLGLLTTVVAVHLALASSASATEITSSTGSTPTITMELSNLELSGPYTTTKYSKSTLHSTAQGHGAGVPATGKISKGGLTFTGCNHAVAVINEGSLSITYTATTGSGTVRFSNGVIEVHTSVGVCRIETNATHIGSLTSAEHSVLAIASAAIPFHGTSFFCGGSGTWKGHLQSHSSDKSFAALARNPPVLAK